MQETWKMTPKCIKKSIFGKGREKGAKKSSASDAFGCLLATILEQNQKNGIQKGIQKTMPTK